MRTALNRIAISLLLALLGLQATVPHAQSAGSHEAEICTGHLDSHGSPDVDHGGGCHLCSTRLRQRFQLPCAAVDLTRPETVRAVPLDLQVASHVPPARSSTSPRAPPAPLSHA
jgi:hypothetical protein